MKYAYASVIVLTLTLIACGGGEEDAGGSAKNELTPIELDITARDFAFDPADLTGSVGQNIEVTLANTGSAPHTFTIDEYNVDEEVPAGEEVSFTILPSEPGEFNFYCRFHQDQGMFGAIIATGEESAAPDEPVAEETPDDDPYNYYP
jgi:plastocyanin